MTHAELLRKHATEATNEGGIWFSGPYMDVLAKVAESLEAENAKLRELARGLGQCAQGVGCEDCLLYDRSEPDHCREERLSRELGIEVPE